MFDAVHDKLIDIYGGKTSNLSKDTNLNNDFVETMWNACVREANLAPNWFQILFYGTMSSNDLKLIQKQGNADIFDELKHGESASMEMISNVIARKTPDQIARSFRQRELFVDM